MSLHLFAIMGFKQPVPLKELKVRYKELAKRYHPDVCREAGAAERFKLVSNAYQQLLKLPLPPEAPQPKEPRSPAEQICWRMLKKNKSNSYKITYPNSYILQKTRFNFMFLGDYGSQGEFSIFVEDEMNLPTILEIKLSQTIKVEIVEGYD